MRSFAVLLLALAYCEARPNFDVMARAALSPDSYIIGGVDADPHEFPWQLTQERLGSTWSHSCGASLLSATYALSASHCLDGATSDIIRVIAGVHDRRVLGDAVTSQCQSYRMHEAYGAGEGTYSNDIAIITLAQSIAANGDTIKYATLPPDNNDQFVGRSLVISGWGRTSISNAIPDILQKATIGVVSTEECNRLLTGVSGALATDNMICLYDTAQQRGSCNGDSGGPANIKYPNDDSTLWVVSGVTSWGVSGVFQCRQTYPSVYTRTSAYLDWIKLSTP